MSKQNPVMTMIVPGRRAMGEDWSKVVIRPDPDTGTYLVEREATPAPADRSPIFVPGLGNISTEMADFILERSRDESSARAKRPRQSAAEVKAEINRVWQDYCEQKLRGFQGRTTVGPAGMHQRERSPDRHGR